MLNLLQPTINIVSRYNILIKPRALGGKENMVKIQNMAIFSEPKTTTKQIPLFEEEEDGNLIPYNNED